MDLITLVIVLIVVGVGLYLNITAYIRMEPSAPPPEPSELPEQPPPHHRANLDSFRD